MNAILVLGDQQDASIAAAAAKELETAGVLLVRPIATDTGVRLLVVDIDWARPDDYEHRSHDSLSMRSSAYTRALSRAGSEGILAIWLHTHPGAGAWPVPSVHDEAVDESLRDVFQLRTATDFYGAVVVSPLPEGDWIFTGHIETDGRRHSIQRALTVGEGLRLRRHFRAEQRTADERFDRNVRAFGGEVQHALGDLSIAVVGAGGTGSATAEQLVRLGVRTLTLIDPDSLEASNVSRVYGSTAADVGEPKVEVLARQLSQIAPDLRVTPVRSSITVLEGAQALRGADVVFGCTDDNAGRLILSRHAYFYAVPVIDCGILISSDDQQNLQGIDGRVTRIGPGAACLLCRDRVDTAMAAAELLDPEEYQRLRQDGYVPALPGHAPAVVTFTTLIASLAVTEFLELLIGFGTKPRPTELLARIHDREIRCNRAAPREGHYCDPHLPQMRGDAIPHLELMWTK